MDLRFSRSQLNELFRYCETIGLDPLSVTWSEEHSPSFNDQYHRAYHPETGAYFEMRPGPRRAGGHAGILYECWPDVPRSGGSGDWNGAKTIACRWLDVVKRESDRTRPTCGASLGSSASGSRRRPTQSTIRLSPRTSELRSPVTLTRLSSGQSRTINSLRHTLNTCGRRSRTWSKRPIALRGWTGKPGCVDVYQHRARVGPRTSESESTFYDGHAITRTAGCRRRRVARWSAMTTRRIPTGG